MLFHVIATHTPQDCPGYSPERMPDLIGWIEGVPDRAKELGVKVHFMVSAAPEHVSYALLEADSVAPVTFFLNSTPMRQDFRVTPVTPEQELAAMGRQMMAARQRG